MKVSSDAPRPRGRRVTRRGFIRTALGVALAASTAGGLAAFYALRVEPGWVQITHRDVYLPRLTKAFDGLTIAQISDIHRGPYMSESRLREVVRLANNLAPDLVLLTGDFVHGTAIYGSSCAQVLGDLAAPHGVYAVLGNHDVWASADGIARNLEQAGIRVLRDNRQSLEANGERLWLLGLEDAGITGFAGEAFDGFRNRWRKKVALLGELLGDIPTAEPRLLLVHNPDVSELLVQVPVDLALCGHTHGGQVRIPLLGPPIVPSYFGSKYASGLIEAPGSLVYVNRGIGVIEPPVRLNCRPEITLLRLHPR